MFHALLSGCDKDVLNCLLKSENKSIIIVWGNIFKNSEREREKLEHLFDLQDGLL